MRSISEVIQFPLVQERTRDKIRTSHLAREEATLIRRLQAHDEIAFREIVDRYQPKVFSVIRTILRNHNDIEDIAQQVFAKIYLSVRNFDSRCSLFTWICKITVNECYDYLRKRQVRRLIYESDFSADEVQRLEASKIRADPVAPVDHRLAQCDFVWKLLSKISDQDRSLILLKEVEGHSTEELAAITGLKENTIKVRMFRTRHKLLKAAKLMAARDELVRTLVPRNLQVRAENI